MKKTKVFARFLLKWGCHPTLGPHLGGSCQGDRTVDLPAAAKKPVGSLMAPDTTSSSSYSPLEDPGNDQFQEARKPWTHTI